MIFRILLYIGLGLLLPGFAALGYSLWEGPAAWSTDVRTFWGTPISLFVFWIGIAHAGTLISAIFLALDVHLDRRTSMLAELTTLCALVVAAIFPLMHLGVLENFYMVIPFLDARENFANLRSPLVWDFCCIAIYGILSALFFVIHLGSHKFEQLKTLRKPMAWLLFPLVLWVHTIVSLDFAVTFVPEWRGAFFPLYFIAGAIYSGLAMVIALLAAEGRRIRLLEKIMMAFSWLMFLFWVWNFALKGDWSVSAFIFGALLPQLWWVSSIRENTIGRIAIAFSAILGMWLERFFLVAPSEVSETASSFGWTDFGLLLFGLGLFLSLVAFSRIRLRKHFDGDDILIGEVEVTLESESASAPANAAPDETNSSILRFPLLLGILVTILYIVWATSQSFFDTFDLPVVSLIPIVYPLIALVAGIALCARNLWNIAPRKLKLFFVIGVGMIGFAAGAYFAGGSSAEPVGEISGPKPNTSDPALSTSGLALSNTTPEALWNARCAACHGTDGSFNEKFVREFYPLPQKLSSGRLDSLGEDSLVNVILNGRINMNPYGGRISREEAVGLVRHLRALAGEDSIAGANSLTGADSLVGTDSLAGEKSSAGEDSL